MILINLFSLHIFLPRIFLKPDHKYIPRYLYRMHFYRLNILIGIHKCIILNLINRDSISLEFLLLQEVSTTHIDVL